MIAQRHLGLMGVSAGFFAVSVSSFGAYLGSKMQLSAAATERSKYVTAVTHFPGIEITP
jgi:hypothetical protein